MLAVEFFTACPKLVMEGFEGGSTERFGVVGGGMVIAILVILSMIVAGRMSWLANAGVNLFMKIIYFIFAFLGGFNYIFYYLISKPMGDTAHGMAPLGFFRANWNKPAGDNPSVPPPR